MQSGLQEVLVLRLIKLNKDQPAIKPFTFTPSARRFIVSGLDISRLFPTLEGGDAR